MAVIGCGPIGLLHARAIEESSGAELVGLCEVDAQRRGAAQRRLGVPAYENIDELLVARQPDAVTIATPDHLHVQPALAAIDAGCHLFCEKPLASNVREAEKLVIAAADRNVLLAVDYNRRFAFGYRIAHKKLVGQEIGHLEHCLIRVTDPTPPPRVAREPFVILSTLLTHHFDLVRWYGGEIRRLHAEANEMSRGLLSGVSISLDMVSGVSARIVAAYRDDQTSTAEWMELKGDAGTILVEELGRRINSDGSKVCGQDTMASDASTEDAITVSILKHVGEFIRSTAIGQQPPVTGDDGLAGLKLAAAAVESITTGKSIDLI